MKKISFFIIVTIITAVFTFSVFAVSPKEPPVPWLSYDYGVWNTSIPAQPAYEPVATVTGTDLGAGPILLPSDLCTDSAGNIYILDSGNKRIVVIDSEMQFIREIHMTEAPSGLVEPHGICLDGRGFLYIADRGAKQVFVCTSDGRYDHSIIKPVTDLIDEKTDFLPDKVLVDKLGVVYVLSFGSYAGAWTFDSAGGFLGFYGSNKVNVTAQLKSDQVWRKIATKKQRERMYRYVPVEYVNFDMDKDGFIYTVSNYGDNEQKGQVRKLNPLSQNILFSGQKPNLMFFGDWEMTYTNKVEKSSLSAVNIDQDNFINVLDVNRGRIFQYDQQCDLVAIFGGPGEQTGTFRNAVDLVSSHGSIYVLDNVKGSVTQFKPTRFGAAMRKATILYEDGYYEQALDPWFEALKIDRTNFLVLRGIGRAYDRMKQYDKAMDYYKQGEFHGGYSDAFYEYRTAFLRKHFAALLVIIFTIIMLPFVVPPLKQKFGRKKAAHHVYETSSRQYPFYLMLHPFKGWEELKHDNKGSVLYANIIVLLSFVMSIFEYQYTGFIFNGNRLDQMNIFVLFGSTVGVFVLWCIANWSMSALMDGKGTFREVWIYTAYSLMTSVLWSIPIILLSNVLTRDEGFFLSLVVYAVQGITYLNLLLAVKAMHQYTLRKTIGSILLTAIGIVLIVIIGLLFVSLFTQMWSLITTVTREIMMRI
jgi:tetratricopeptide (TPR) repeat protein